MILRYVTILILVLFTIGSTAYALNATEEKIIQDVAIATNVSEGVWRDLFSRLDIEANDDYPVNESYNRNETRDLIEYAIAANFSFHNATFEYLISQAESAVDIEVAYIIENASSEAQKINDEKIEQIRFETTELLEGTQREVDTKLNKTLETARSDISTSHNSLVGYVDTKGNETRLFLGIAIIVGFFILWGKQKKKTYTRVNGTDVPFEALDSDQYKTRIRAVRRMHNIAYLVMNGGQPPEKGDN